MKIAYLEPIFGASGDMILSAFVNAGLPVDYLTEKLRAVIPVNFFLQPVNVLDHGVNVTRLDIMIDKELNFRGLNEIKEIFSKSKLNKHLIEKSLNVFEKLAEVESKIHNIDKKKVHFHELGAVDTIIDIVGFFIALDFFKIKKVYTSKIPLGNGIIQSEHGFMPVPAFATLELLKKIPVFGVEISSENITPTAAALINATAVFSHFPEMQISHLGYGGGHKSFLNYRNMLRITIGDKNDSFSNEKILVMQFNVDDMTPEFLANFMEKVINAGAKDCFFSPVIGKKGRPATLVTVLTSLEEKEKICDIIFSETTTIGVRYRIEDRFVLKREQFIIKTSLGKVRVKRTFFNESVDIKPEFEDLKRISLKRAMPLKEVYSVIIRELKGK